MTFDLRNQVCIVGVGESEFGRVLDDQSQVRLQTAALRAALDDAGLTKDDIDGFNTAHGAPMGSDYDEYAMYAGLNLRWVNQNWTHGRWAGTSIAQTALALAAGLCNYAVIVNTTTSRNGYLRHFPRATGWNEGLRDATGGQGQVSFHGLDTPGSSTSLVAREYMRRYGATSEELGTVATTFRKHAQLNPKAIMRDRPMTLDDYLESRFISPPFRLFDYCLTNEGSVAMILTTVERARALKQQPVFIGGLQGIQASRNDHIAFARPGLAVGFQEEFKYVAPRQQVYDMAGVGPQDVDALYMYDSFSTNLWVILERFGFCGEGEAHEWIQDGRIELGGELPVNTNGGLMS
ncbi:MAG: thiolase family protein, partial [Dehalococcoidia bacterium]